MSKRLVPTEWAAEFLNVSNARVYALIREGILPAVRLGRQVRIDREQLEKFIAKGGQALPGGWKREAR